ncbi:unnamed protein product [Vicia faba]|uniref:Phage protein n=1 Tax=Vicia faba TaxID=3906 RepID=A0AAV0ZCM7_VICFA|nr:unnamed protein product [Vicia faba]
MGRIKLTIDSRRSLEFDIGAAVESDVARYWKNLKLGSYAGFNVDEDSRVEITLADHLYLPEDETRRFARRKQRQEVEETNGDYQSKTENAMRMIGR